MGISKQKVKEYILILLGMLLHNLENKSPMGHIAYPRNQFKPIYFEKSNN